MYLLVKRWLKRTINLSINPCAEVEGEKENYHWVDSNPVFSIDLSNNVIQGYYMLELTVTNASSNMLSEFVWNSDASNHGSFKLPVKSNGCFKRICYFPKTLEALNWIPSGYQGSIGNVEIALKKVSKGFSASRMKKKLKLKSFKGSHDNLLNAYEAVFEPSVHNHFGNVQIDALGQESFIYLSNKRLMCLTTSGKKLSREDRQWIESNDAATFVRTSSGLIKRMEK